MSDALSDDPTTEDETGIDLTPMLDVVFIMLIFFIVSATFVKEAGVDVQRPEATTAERQDLANILIAITPEDDVWIDGNRIDERDMATVIKRLHAENPQGSVVVQADQLVQGEMQVRVQVVVNQTEMLELTPQIQLEV